MNQKVTSGMFCVLICASSTVAPKSNTEFTADVPLEEDAGHMDLTLCPEEVTGRSDVAPSEEDPVFLFEIIFLDIFAGGSSEPSSSFSSRGRTSSHHDSSTMVVR